MDTLRACGLKNIYDAERVQLKRRDTRGRGIEIIWDCTKSAHFVLPAQRRYYYAVEMNDCLPIAF